MSTVMKHAVVISNGCEAERTNEAPSHPSFHINVSVRIRATLDSQDELLPMSVVSESTGQTSLMVEHKQQASAKSSFSGRGTSNKETSNTTMKSYKGFYSILDSSTKNYAVYETILAPLVTRVLHHQETACCFAYGHTGSGKTHTIIGYGEEELGLYRYAVDALIRGIREVEDSSNNGKDLQLQIRCAELYQGKVYDLLSDSHHEECFLREDRDGNIHIRSATLLDPVTGCVRVHSLHAAYAKSSDDVIALVQMALANRCVGNSTIHTQSSRSHAVIELQLVTPDVIAAREELLEAEARLVPIGKAKDGKYISVMSQIYKPDPEKKGAYIEDRSQVPVSEFEELARLEQAVAKAEEEVNQAREREQTAVEAATMLLPRSGESTSLTKGPGKRECPTLVLVDLAGAEYASAPTSKSSFTKQGETSGPIRTAQDVAEGKEINSSLLALKECMRALANGSNHVPFRNSKLTMLLRRYLRSEAASAAMIATITPSRSQAAATMNTLQYATLLTADAGKK